MYEFLTKFRKKEDGAVTVDWVVLTAFVAGLAVVAYGTIEDGASNLTSQTSVYMGKQDPNP